MATSSTIPNPLRKLFVYFPLYSYPPIPPRFHTPRTPTLWILPPRNPQKSLLSNDIECLKWQAYLALRGQTGIAVRWHVSLDGALHGQLPNLLVAGKEGLELLPAGDLPTWVDERVGSTGPLEGYRDQQALDESQAWVALLEGNVRAALVANEPDAPFLSSWLSPLTPPSHTPSLDKLLAPPPAPFSGLSSLLPPYGTRVSVANIELRYREAVSALSERLGTDKWFLGSDGPTALDAHLFAYLHTLLQARGDIRIEVTKRVNLVAWEWRVRSQVSAAFRSYTEDDGGI